MKPGDRVYVSGHGGLAGSALVRRLTRAGFSDLLTAPRSELDLTDSAAVDRFFEAERPEFVFLAAARVGGIWANQSFPADFLRDNLAIELNVISAAHRWDVKKLVFLGSSCIYPREAPQPIREDSLLTGPLESTNEWYAVAKIAGIKLCQAYRRQFGSDFISLMSTNLYGPNDNFDPESSHVLPALVRRFHEAVHAGDDAVSVWGTGTPRREFLHVDDLADACLFLMENYSSELIVNVGWGKDLTISELAELVAEVSGFEGRIDFDTSRPDGTPRKVLDTTRLNGLGWAPSIPLRRGLRETYDWYVAHRAEGIGAR